MTFPISGPGNPAEYLVSGLPYVTSSTVGSARIEQISFPMVTQWIWIRNHTASSTLRVGFTSASLHVGNLNQFRLHADEYFQGNLRVKTLFLSASLGNPSFSLMAGLTSVQPQHFPTLTSSLTGSGGVVVNAGSHVVVYDGVG